jgi:hypothetical protein
VEGWVLWQIYGGAMIPLRSFLEQHGCAEALQKAKTKDPADALASLLDTTQITREKGLSLSLSLSLSLTHSFPSPQLASHLITFTSPLYLTHCSFFPGAPTMEIATAQQSLGLVSSLDAVLQQTLSGALCHHTYNRVETKESRICLRKAPYVFRLRAKASVSLSLDFFLIATQSFSRRIGGRDMYWQPASGAVRAAWDILWRTLHISRWANWILYSADWRVSSPPENRSTHADLNRASKKQCFFPNTLHDPVKTEPWCLLHAAVGDYVMRHLLTHCAIFVSLPNRNYMQVRVTEKRAV